MELLTVFWQTPRKNQICTELGDGVILMKDETTGQPIGLELLSYRPGDGPFRRRVRGNRQIPRSLDVKLPAAPSNDERQIMKLKVDEKADALYLRLDDSRIIESEEVSPGVILDYNEQNQVVGVEILGLSRRAPSLNLKELQFQAA